ncbi:MAG TPA: YwiC-like family protein [Candidatus Binatia bacterium]|nr:YwiC-like family protein [Candidatus Binatia bacterium]
MPEGAAHLATVPSRPIGTLIAPREHGAWGLLLVPLFTGGATAVIGDGALLPVIALMIAALLLFWLRTPLESILGTGPIKAQTPHERRTVTATIIVLGGAAAATLISLFWNGHNRGLVVLGAIAVSAFAGQALLRKMGRSVRMLAQVVGVAGLTVTAPAAYYAAGGRLDRTAWALWIANFLFAGNQIHYVQLRIHSARLTERREKVAQGRSFLAGELLLAVILILAAWFQVFPAMAAFAFAPLLLRGAAWFLDRDSTLTVRRLGWTELGHAVAFGVLLVAGLRLGR